MNGGKDMKLSKYNEYTKKEDNLIIYNSVSSGVLLLNKDYQKDLENFLKTGNAKYSEMIEGLKKSQMLVDDEIDELGRLELSSRISRFSTENLSLTIATTSGCNFRCPYCYEEGIEHYSMDKATQDLLLEFVINQHPKKLSVVWYGGEPLLNFDCIEYLSEKFIEEFGDNYTAGIVTNGYLLDKTKANKLKEYHINRIQITLDGTKDIHDTRRILANGNGSFDKIIENIINCCEFLPIVIRTNVDKTNITNVPEIINQLKELGIYDKIKFYIAPVDDVNSAVRNPDCFQTEEFSKMEREYLLQYVDTKTIKPPVMSLSICGAICCSSFVIDPRGKLFKCWDQMGHDEKVVGDLTNGIKHNDVLLQWLNYDPIKEHPECGDCIYFPTCFGGCPYQTLMGRGKRCVTMKYNAPHVIDSLYNYR